MQQKTNLRSRRRRKSSPNSCMYEWSANIHRFSSTSRSFSIRQNEEHMHLQLGKVHMLSGKMQLPTDQHHHTQIHCQQHTHVMLVAGTQCRPMPLPHRPFQSQKAMLKSYMKTRTWLFLPMVSHDRWRPFITIVDIRQGQTVGVHLYCCKCGIQFCLKKI